MSDAAPSDPAVRGQSFSTPTGLSATLQHLDHPFGGLAGGPEWLLNITRLIRPICVGALMAVPTLGPATVGVVALFDEARAMAMVRASTAFLHGIPAEVLLLIGALATGYGLAKSVERLRTNTDPVAGDAADTKEPAR